MSLPNDPVILLSYVNTLLRDEYPSFEELCKSLSIQQSELEGKLSAIGYSYDREKNQFK